MPDLSAEALEELVEETEEMIEGLDEDLRDKQREMNKLQTKHIRTTSEKEAKVRELKGSDEDGGELAALDTLVEQDLISEQEADEERRDIKEKAEALEDELSDLNEEFNEDLEDLREEHNEMVEEKNDLEGQLRVFKRMLEKAQDD